MKLFKKASCLLSILAGERYRVISESLCICEETIRLWKIDFMVLQLESLKFKKPGGRPSKLSNKQKEELIVILKAGPELSGFISGCWNTPMIQQLIEKRYGVLYTPQYISELLKTLGFTFQKAAFMGANRDQQLREEWLTKTWPLILKNAQKKNCHILFGDEASFPQWGSLSRTWAPVGEQPIIKTSGSRKAFKVFGLIEYFTGKFYTKGIEGKFNSESYSSFLLEVMSKTKKHLFIIQDNARYHTSNEMKDFFKKHKDKMTVYNLPVYTPDFNPIEIMWKKGKLTGVHLKYFPTFEDLTLSVTETLCYFEDVSSEVLAVFGFYTKLKH
jgi:transposase